MMSTVRGTHRRGQVSAARARPGAPSRGRAAHHPTVSSNSKSEMRKKHKGDVRRNNLSESKLHGRELGNVFRLALHMLKMSDLKDRHPESFVRSRKAQSSS